MEKKMAKDKVIAYVWLALFVVIATAISFYFGDSWIAYFASISGVICVYLVSRESVWNYPIGIINIVLLLIITWQTKLFGDFMLNIYFFGITFYGSWFWIAKRDKKKGEKVARTKKFTITGRLLLILICIILFVAYAILLAFLGDPFPYPDSFTNVCSIVAMFLMSIKRIESWYLWIAVDVVSIFMYLGVGEFVVAFMWLAFLVNAFYGLAIWKKRMEAI
jgi:nicotinamide mononucleotide transporter